MSQIILLLLLTAAVLIAISFHLRVRRLIRSSENLSIRYTSLSETGEALKIRMEQIMNSFPSPVLLIDRDGIISFANAEAKKLAGAGEIEGNNYLKFFKEPDFINSVQEVHKNALPFEREVSLSGRTFLTRFCPLGEEGDVLISGRDVTAEKELERIKQELVTNMSHELKTPLTAIKGYVETLYDEIPTEPQRHLDIIRKHTDRLINIVNDILSLSGLEEIKKIEIRLVDIKEIVDGVLKMFAGKIKDKNLTLEVAMDEENRYVRGDRFKIEEMFINLVDNALRYTDKGSIAIKSHRKDSSLIISIKDTGIGIPERDLPRIFERFYVVDKSRSKETGGTGLGLSIVKHIVMLHKGEIDIKSSLSAGTEVLLTLPLSEVSS
ncbi:MAG: PAS domain-containing protein [Candidatus Omnitrophica bacterium]|nr:PAS domain-containing protein [Candidatus Omnitrophota bacterium]